MIIVSTYEEAMEVNNSGSNRQSKPAVVEYDFS